METVRIEADENLLAVAKRAAAVHTHLHELGADPEVDDAGLAQELTHIDLSWQALRISCDVAGPYAKHDVARLLRNTGMAGNNSVAYAQDAAIRLRAQQIHSRRTDEACDR